MMTPGQQRVTFQVTVITDRLRCFAIGLLLLVSGPGLSQSPPSETEVNSYTGLHRAAHLGDVPEIEKLVASGTDLEQVDGFGRTALHIAAFGSHEDVVLALARAGSNMNALENQAYDIVTIAAVANDLEVLDTALNNGASPSNITSPYDGTALIAAAHLGHHEVVKRLIDAGAPLDHINNINWTALIEAVVLGDGGPNHIQTARHLINAGADKSITDGYGRTPLDLARERGYQEMIRLLEE